MRQLVTESLLLAFVAGVSGLLLAYWGSKALVALAPADLPRLAETGIDRWVLAFTLGISMITSLLFGLVPALYASRVELERRTEAGSERALRRAAGWSACVERLWWPKSRWPWRWSPEQVC